jgi:hypothetical protein
VGKDPTKKSKPKTPAKIKPRPGEAGLTVFYQYLSPRSLRGGGGVGLFLTAIGLAPHQPEPFDTGVRVLLNVCLLLSAGMVLFGIAFPDKYSD